MKNTFKRCMCGCAVLSVLVLGSWGSWGTCAHAAEEARTTILSGKVVSMVTRAKALPFTGIVEELLVSSGQEVAANEVLMKYSLTEEAKRALQKELLQGAGTEDTKAQILTLRGELSSLKAQSNKARQLASAGLGSSQASARSADEVKLLQERIELLQQTLQKKEESFKQRLDELSGYFGAPITSGSDLPKLLVLTSPMAGHVLSVAPHAEKGAQLGAGSTPVLVGKMDPMGIQVQVYEGEIGRIQVGDKASVTIPSLNDKAFEATVSQIAWTSSSLDVAQPSYFTVELTIPNAQLELKPGFKAVVQFSAQ